MSIWVFAGPDHRGAATQAAIFGTAILVGGGALIDAFNAAGVYRHDPSMAPYGRPLVEPYVVVDADLIDLEPGTQMLFGLFRESNDRLARRLVNAIGDEPGWLKDVLVWVLPAPWPRSVQVQQADTGTAGPEVLWSGCQGFLTAGHVAKSNFGQVRAAAFHGNVRFSSDPAGSGKQPLADVALVEYATPQHQPPWPAARPLSPPLGADDAVHYAAAQPRQDTIRACTPFFKSNAINGTYGEVYQTQAGVSVGGDSGAMVTDANGRVVGSVVAGSAGYFDLVQSIHYQISQIAISGLTVI